jgi:hypothetical protein
MILFSDTSLMAVVVLSVAYVVALSSGNRMLSFLVKEETHYIALVLFTEEILSR